MRCQCLESQQKIIVLIHPHSQCFRVVNLAAVFCLSWANGYRIPHWVVIHYLLVSPCPPIGDSHPISVPSTCACISNRYTAEAGWNTITSSVPAQPYTGSHHCHCSQDKKMYPHTLAGLLIYVPLQININKHLPKQLHPQFMLCIPTKHSNS